MKKPISMIALTTDVLEDSIAEYRKQLEAVTQNIKQLDENYAAQREQGINALHELAGAIAALERLVVTHKQAEPHVEASAE